MSRSNTKSLMMKEMVFKDVETAVNFLLDLGNILPEFEILPNPISKAVSEAIVLAEKEVNLKVNLGISYVVGNTWALCH